MVILQAAPGTFHIFCVSSRWRQRSSAAQHVEHCVWSTNTYSSKPFLCGEFIVINKRVNMALLQYTKRNFISRVQLTRSQQQLILSRGGPVWSCDHRGRGWHGGVTGRGRRRGREVNEAVAHWWRRWRGSGWRATLKGVFYCWNTAARKHWKDKLLYILSDKQ